MVTFLITRCQAQGAGLAGVAITPGVWLATEWLLRNTGRRVTRRTETRTALFSVSGSSSPAHGQCGAMASWQQWCQNNDSQTDVSVQEDKLIIYPSSGMNRDVKRRGIYRHDASKCTGPGSVTGHVTGLMRYESHSSASLCHHRHTERLLFIIFCLRLRNFIFLCAPDGLCTSAFSVSTSRLMRTRLSII